MKEILGNNNLEEWFLTCKEHKFPKSKDYKIDYNLIKSVAVSAQEKIHAGNIEVENLKEKGQRTLTGHDPSHFKKVIHNASELLKASKCELTSYEVFMLLSAIQIHDIGNIIGRENHQLTAIDVFYDLMPANVILDSVETNIFHTIAEVHTQGDDDDKDTISKLNDYEIKHNDAKIRHQLLAAILKLADELADDPERAFMYGVEKDLVKEGSKLHHVYCNSLKSTNIEEKRISITYKFDVDTVMKKYEFGKSKIFLLDYIFKRDIKMHFELIYCQKFMRPDIWIDYIDAEISIYSKDFKKKIVDIKYRLVDKGYPDVNLSKFEIKDICMDPEQQLKNQNGDWWSGQTLKKYINEQSKK
ncbi:MAG: hypothetical protein COB15_01405 [Flavobacteriales bacterium]|nr:MAG: hypothetical protein COB15_01405 [Flavobacteriales bacterium]